jgi:hypothetical protein
LIELVNQGLLFVGQPSRIADNVEKQDMDYLELDFLFNLGGHARERATELFCISVRSSRRNAPEELGD